MQRACEMCCSLWTGLCSSGFSLVNLQELLVLDRDSVARARTHTRVQTHTHARAHTCAHTYTHACTHAHAYTHTHTRARTDAHTSHTRAQTHTYTHEVSDRLCLLQWRFNLLFVWLMKRSTVHNSNKFHSGVMSQWTVFKDVMMTSSFMYHSND